MIKRPIMVYLRVLLWANILTFVVSCRPKTEYPELINAFRGDLSAQQRLDLVLINARPYYDVVIMDDVSHMISKSEYDSLFLNGHAFVLVSGDVLGNAQAESHKLRTEHGDHKLLIVGDSLDQKTEKRLIEQGLVILNQSVHTLDKVLSAKDLKGINFGGGGVLYHKTPTESMRLLKVDPHFNFRGQQKVEWKVYRKDKIDVFVVKNSGSELLQFEAGFRTLAGAPEVWNPVSGEIFEVDNFYQLKGSIRFNIALEPEETLLYVFGTNTDRDYMQSYKL